MAELKTRTARAHGTFRDFTFPWSAFVSLGEPYEGENPDTGEPGWITVLTLSHTPRPATRTEMRLMWPGGVRPINRQQRLKVEGQRQPVEVSVPYTEWVEGEHQLGFWSDSQELARLDAKSLYRLAAQSSPTMAEAPAWVRMRVESPGERKVREMQERKAATAVTTNGGE